MTAFLLRRLAHAVLVILLVATVTFGLVHAAPGGPSILADPKLSIAEREVIVQRLGLDQSLPVQFGRWLGQVARGDLGRSFLYETSTLRTIGTRLPDTLLLAGSALALAVLFAVPLGAMAAARHDRWLDRFLNGVAFVSLSMPAFWLGILVILVFAVRWHLFPAGGARALGGVGSAGDRAWHLVLPALVLSAAIGAEVFRYTRSSVRSALARPFVRTARAKGVSERAARWRHAVRTALNPVVTSIGLQLPRLVGGAAITETVFSWPGMGRLGIEAALARDYPLVMATTLVVSAGVLACTLLVDLAYYALDPRTRSPT